jgi:hypothetical protein
MRLGVVWSMLIDWELFIVEYTYIFSYVIDN